ncbi:MAG: TetR/AcrR family transcriptional regulator [Acidimicrobiaceae bacterium]|nr:TetR/AcrR family transcriptional regulator [Ilumatobacter sp.]MCB9380317.1 TetR/AcrR family transcriptional regulator [Acidimicrobiaceae bacterium]MCO5329299.1 TetR/AcrR family transcriptional regulator [Ilumatobacteraceae bacterium]
MSAATVSRLDDVGNALLEAADRLLAAEGAGALTIRRMAAEAGVSTMNVYSRFGGKDGVVEQLFLNGFALLAARLDAVPTTDDPLADLQGCGQAYRCFALDQPTLYSVMFDRVVPDFDPGEQAMSAAFATLGHLAARLQRAMEHGLLRPADPLHAAGIVWSTCHGVVSLELKGMKPDVIDWPAVYAGATAAIIAGMAA